MTAADLPAGSEDGWPAYTFVPGLSPHPIRDPRGHHFADQLPPAEPLVPEQWRQNPLYCRAIALFNAGYFWEAHECWESIWHRMNRAGPVAQLLKGLIHFAAAGVKAYEGRPDGVARHLRRAAELLAELELSGAYPAGANYCGIRPGGLAFVALQAASSQVQREIEPPVPSDVVLGITFPI